MATYHPWEHPTSDPSLAWIDASPDSIIQDDFRLNEGVSCADWFPDDVVFDVSDDYGIKLADSIPNMILLRVVSDRLRKVLEQHAGASIEFLPVRIRDKKRRLVKAPYYVANLLGSVACMDRSRSDFDMSHLDKGQVSRFRRLTLDPSKIDPSVKIFRLAEMMELVLVRDDLAAAIERAGCTGLDLLPLEDFGAEYRPRGAT